MTTVSPAAPGREPRRKRALRTRSRSATRAFSTRLCRAVAAHDIALVFADLVEWPYAEDVTADFVYLRLHGSEELYASGYSDEALDRWAARLRLWARGRQPNDAAADRSDARAAARGRATSLSISTTTLRSAPRSTRVRCARSLVVRRVAIRPVAQASIAPGGPR